MGSHPQARTHPTAPMRSALLACLIHLFIPLPQPAAAHDARDALTPRDWRLPSASLSLPLTAFPDPEPTPEPTHKPTNDEPPAPSLSPSTDELGADTISRFASARSQWLTFGGGWANNFDKENDFNLHITYSYFLADKFELAVEGGLWYFDQRGRDAVGFNGNLILRWHLLHDDEFNWTGYIDAGMGILASTSNVPSGGTSFGFTPRIGLGFTRRLGDGPARFQAGIRWHHISNARIQGDSRNPARDAPMIYAGIIIPLR